MSPKTVTASVVGQLDGLTVKGAKLSFFDFGARSPATDCP